MFYQKLPPAKSIHFQEKIKSYPIQKSYLPQIRITRSPSNFTLKAQHDSTLRANPFPEVTDPFCRLPLSTLFYRLEAVHLGDLLRLSVRPSMKLNLSLGFSRVVESAPDTQAYAKYSTNHQTPSPDNLIPRSLSNLMWNSIVKKKRELFPGPSPTSPSSFHVTIDLRRNRFRVST